MKNLTVSRAALILIGASTILGGGCATVVRGTTQTVTVKTDPPGAACDLTKSGKSLGFVNPTPGTALVDKGSADLDVTCRKPGHFDASGKLSSSFQAWTLGNALIGGLVGVVVDAGSGAMHEYQPEIFLWLLPEGFDSVTTRDTYFDGRRAEVERQAASARTAITGKCSGSSCDKPLKALDEKAEQSFQELEAARKVAKVDAASATVSPPIPMKATAAPSSTTTPDASTSTAVLTTNEFKVGERWTYNFKDQGKNAGTISFEITEATGRKARERVTREGYKNFSAERNVEVAFDPVRFLDPVVLPGGYYVTELAPYMPAGMTLQAGTAWESVPGSFSAGIDVNRKFQSRVMVIGKETVRVPAGTFQAWRVDTESEENTILQGVRMKFRCTYWYAPEFKRTVKMRIHSIVTGHARKTDEVYELATYTPPK